MKQLIIIPVLFIFLFCGAAHSLEQTNEAPVDSVRSLEGVIIKVKTAGELVLWTKKGVHPFTLYGIDLPDPASVKGREAQKKVSDLIFNKLLHVHLMEENSGKPPGIVVVRGECVNEKLVRTGVARVAESCTAKGRCDRWREAEQKARAEKAGLWKTTD